MPSNDEVIFLILFTIVIFLPLTIFWMIVAWRAMRAHEKIADYVEWMVRKDNTQEQETNRSDIL